jgi:dTDP-4-dehydrorhamnose reductase
MKKGNMFRQQRLLVVGSSGYLGRVIAKKLNSGYFVVPTHNKNRYFPDSVQYSFPGDDLSRLVKANGVDTCIFAAEIEKNQGGLEHDDLDSFHQAVEELVQSLSIIRFVYVSSDGIFSGRQGLYSESAIPQPATAYGRKLKICEDAIRSLCPDYCIVRPSYLYGHSLGTLDSRLNRTRSCYQSQEDVSYFDDMYKSPLHVVDAANLIISLAFSDYVGTVHIGGPRMNVHEFHKEAMEAMGMVGKISANKVPADASLLRDTSLDVRLCTQLTGYVPKSVTRSLMQYSGKRRAPREGTQ